MARTFDAMVPKGRRTEAYVCALQYVHTVPGYLALKENMVEDSVETVIKPPEPEGMETSQGLRVTHGSDGHFYIATKVGGTLQGTMGFDTGATAHIMHNDMYMYNLRPMKQTITAATVYPVQSKGDVILRSICGAILVLKGVLYIPTANNIISGSKIVQNPEHRVEIDSVCTRIICNTGTCPTLHLNYDNEGELWYFIGDCVSPLHIVTEGTVSEDAEEVEQELMCCITPFLN
jgi:hypothetical protein